GQSTWMSTPSWSLCVRRTATFSPSRASCGAAILRPSFCSSANTSGKVAAWRARPRSLPSINQYSRPPSPRGLITNGRNCCSEGSRKLHVWSVSMTWVSASITAMAFSPSRVQRGPIVDVLEPQRPAQEPLLLRAANRALHRLAHRPQADGIWIVSEDRGLLLEVLSREEEGDRLGSPGVLVGHFLGSLEGSVELECHPRMLLENPVLDDHVVIRLEASGLSKERVDGLLAVVVQQLLQSRVALDRRATPAIDDGRISGGDAGLGPDGRARVDLAAVEHHVQRLIHGEPVMRDADWPLVVQAERAPVAQRLGSPVVPDVVLGLDAVQILQRDPEPQRGGHVVVGDADPLPAEIGEARDAGGRVHV